MEVGLTGYEAAVVQIEEKEGGEDEMGKRKGCRQRCGRREEGRKGAEEECECGDERRAVLGEEGGERTARRRWERSGEGGRGRREED